MAPAAAAGSAAGGGRGEGIEGADGGGGDGRPRARGQRAGEDDRGPVPSRERGHPHGARGRARKRAQQPPPLDGAPDSDREAPAPATLGLTASAGLLAVGLVARALARRRTRRRAAAAAAAERAAAAQAAAVARREAEQRAAARAVALAELEAKFEPLPNCKLVPRAELARPWSPVGGGSFGSVFSTSWLGQPVVAKRLKRVRDLADVDALVAEAAVLGAIGPHPCIGLYYGVSVDVVDEPARGGGEGDGSASADDGGGGARRAGSAPVWDRLRPDVALIMDLAEGDLSMLLYSRDSATGEFDYPLSLADALGLALQIAQALAHLHSTGVAHMDLKPENVLLEAAREGTPTVAGGRWRARVADFGLARISTYQRTNSPTSTLQGSTVSSSVMSSVRGARGAHLAASYVGSTATSAYRPSAAVALGTRGAEGTVEVGGAPMAGDTVDETEAAGRGAEEGRGSAGQAAQDQPATPAEAVRAAAVAAHAAAHGAAPRNRRVGTYAFMPPEAFSTSDSDMDGSYDERCDVYSFGVLLWTLMTRERPWQRCGSRKELVARVTSGERPPLRLPHAEMLRPQPPQLVHLWPAGTPPGVASRFAELVRACWHHEPAARPDMSTAITELQAIAAESAAAAARAPSR